MLHDWCALSVNSGPLSPELHKANLVIYGGFLLVMLLFTGSFRISGIVTYLVSMVFGLAMYYTIMFRGIALYAADIFSLSAAKEVMGGYDYSLGSYQWAGIAIGAAGILITFLCRGRIELNWKRRVVMVLMGVLLLYCLYGMYFKWEKFPEAHIKLYHPQTSYQKYGTAYGFLCSFNYLKIEEPEGYSVKEAENIAAEYREKADSAGPAAKPSDMPNIIVVMDETLCDMQNLGPVSFTTNQDVFPFLHSLEENTQKGDLYVSRIGGGTAIMEFEMLTGNTNAFLPNGTIAYQTLVRDPLPSLASQLRNIGYDGIIASHPFHGNGYNRINAYPLIGFKETRFIEDMDLGSDSITIGQYTSDEAAFKEIISEYETVNNKTDAPFFAFQVTMQNHTPYLQQSDPEIVIEDDFVKYPELQDFLNYMHETDRALKGLFEYFEGCDEPTVIAVFGDHPPRFEKAVFKRLLGLKKYKNTMNVMKARRTPLYIWANYDIEEKELGPISTNYIADHIVKAAGVPETGYQLFLSELQEDVPVINALGYWGSDGKYYSVNDKESPYWEKVNQYNILEYNNLVDRGHRIEGFFE